MLETWKLAQFWGGTNINDLMGCIDLTKSALVQFSGAKRPQGSSVVCLWQWLINESPWIIGPRTGSHLTLVTWMLISHLKPILIVMYYLTNHFSTPFNCYPFNRFEEVQGLYWILHFNTAQTGGQGSTKEMRTIFFHSWILIE